MKTILSLLIAMAVVAASSTAHAADAKTTTKKTSVAPSDPDVKANISAISAKLRDKKKTEADFAEEIKKFDELIAAKKGSAPEGAAQAAYYQATLYVQVFNDPKGDALLAAVTKDYPNTYYGKRAQSTLAAAKSKREADAKFAVGKKFPGFAETDTAGRPLSIDGFKGKVLLVDFWATWCGPCIGELPNVKKTYAAHHPAGFEIVGISLDSEQKKLTDFVAKNNMPWPQFFDGQGWKNKLATQYGIHSIPATFLLDGTGTIIAKNLRGDALEEAVVKALKR